MITGKNITPTSLAQAQELLAMAERKSAGSKPPEPPAPAARGKNKSAVKSRKHIAE